MKVCVFYEEINESIQTNIHRPQATQRNHPMQVKTLDQKARQSLQLRQFTDQHHREKHRLDRNGIKDSPLTLARKARRSL